MRKKREIREDESEDSCTDDVVGMNGLDPCNQNPTATHITSIEQPDKYHSVPAFQSPNPHTAIDSSVNSNDSI